MPNPNPPAAPESLSLVKDISDALGLKDETSAPAPSAGKPEASKKPVAKTPVPTKEVEDTEEETAPPEESTSEETTSEETGGDDDVSEGEEPKAPPAKKENLIPQSRVDEITKGRYEAEARAKLLAEENERLKNGDKGKEKQTQEVTEDDLLKAIEYWSNASDEDVPNRHTLVAKANAELSKRGAKKGAEEVHQSQAFEAERKAWDQAVSRDFPEIFVEKEGKQTVNLESPLFQLAQVAYQNPKLNLKSIPNGSYIAFEWAVGRLAVMEKANKSKQSNGQHNHGSKPAPPPMKGAPNSSGTGSSAPGKKEAAKAKSNESLDKYSQSKDSRDLVAAIAARL